MFNTANALNTKSKSSKTLLKGYLKNMATIGAIKTITLYTQRVYFFRAPNCVRIAYTIHKEKFIRSRKTLVGYFFLRKPDNI